MLIVCVLALVAKLKTLNTSTFAFVRYIYQFKIVTSMICSCFRDVCVCVCVCICMCLCVCVCVCVFVCAVRYETLLLQND